MRTINRRRQKQTRALVCALGLIAVTAMAVVASYPSWWDDRETLDHSVATNDYAIANIGQLKWFATNAYDEFEEEILLLGGAGPEIEDLLASFGGSNDYAAVNIGQLKHVASLFYDRLIAEAFTNAYPWAGAAETNDYAAANVGQLKNVFSFDLASWPESTDTSFTVDRGFYTGSFTVTVSSATNALIYYTTDGTTPSLTNGNVVTGSVDIVISGTTVLRVIAHEDGRKPTDIDNQTYLFLDDIIARTDGPAGYTNTWHYADGTNLCDWGADYGMDPEIVQDVDYTNVLEGALLSIPTLCLTAEHDDLFGSDGMYFQNTDDGYERPAGIELIYPDGRDGYHANCSLKPHSRAWEFPDPSTNAINVKRSFRLSFKKEYWETSCEAPIFEM